MAVLTTKSEIITKGQLGETIILKWKIKNASKREWPAKPLLRNFSDDLLTVDKVIDTALSPN